MSEDAPTLRLPAAQEPQPLPPSAPPPPPAPSRGPFIAFVIVAILLLGASGLLVYVLLHRDGGSPSTLDTPAPTHSTTTTSPPPPPVQPPPPGQFTSLVTPQAQRCEDHGKDHGQTDAQVSWSTTNAAQVWIAPGLSDADSPQGQQVPASGNQDSIPQPLQLDCGERMQSFTITLVGQDGAHVSRTWTVTTEGRH